MAWVFLGFGETGFGELGFSEMGFGEMGHNPLLLQVTNAAIEHFTKNQT